MPRKAKTDSQADLNAAPGGVAAVDKALTLLTSYQAKDKGLTLNDFAERTGLYKSTSLRLLSSLVHFGLLERRNDGAYVLGNELSRLHGIHQTSYDLGEVVMPQLVELVRVTGESAAFHVRQGAGASWVRLCLYRVDSPQMVRDHVKAGDVLPADKGAGARVLIAYGPADLVPKDEASQRLYEDVRRQGYWANVGDRTAELGGISAPVLKANGELVGAVTLTMPAHRYNPSAIEAVVKAANQVAARLP